MAFGLQLCSSINYDHDIQYHLGKANIIVDALSWKVTGKLNSLLIEQRGLLREMEELELEVITWGWEGPCVTIIMEPVILEEIKLKKMEKLKLKMIFNSQVANLNLEFKMIDGVFKFRNRICAPDVFDLKRQIMEEWHKSKWTIHPRMIKMYQDLKKIYWWMGMKWNIKEYVDQCL